MGIWTEGTDIYNELMEVEETISKALKTRQTILSKGIEELLKAGGKRLRPALVLLSGQFGQYDRKKLVSIAAGIEILHMATLVHDDIIDDAHIRRGAPTVQAKWGKDIAVFTGDFLLTRCFSLITQNVSLENMHKLSNAMKAICEGEVDQHQSQYDLSISINDYLKRIARKTALLFALSCRVGAEEAKCSPRDIWNLWKLGKNLGMAFQIVDDLLDFSGDVQVVGKPLLADFANGVFTLPIIYMVGNPKYRNKLKEIVDEGQFTRDELESVQRWVHEEGALDKSKELADRFIKKAVKNLEALPAIPARDYLENLTVGLEERQY
ncbi:MAG: polyprenyl synthetase family protein [Clostridiales bacterium]|nr:polyprenyl synthetase family protein [Clostridiales bacterium]